MVSTWNFSVYHSCGSQDYAWIWTVCYTSYKKKCFWDELNICVDKTEFSCWNFGHIFYTQRFEFSCEFHWCGHQDETCFQKSGCNGHTCAWYSCVCFHNVWSLHLFLEKILDILDTEMIFHDFSWCVWPIGAHSWIFLGNLDIVALLQVAVVFVQL